MTFPPCAIEQRCDEDVLPALNGIGVDTDQTEHARYGRHDSVAQGFLVRHDRRPRSGERAEHRDRDASLAAWCVDGPLDGTFERPDSCWLLTLRLEPIAPEVGGPLGVLVRRPPMACRVGLIDPGAEVLRTQRGEGQQEVPQIAFRVDRDYRDPVNRGLFDQRHAQTGLTAAGHTDTDGVGREVLCVVEQWLGCAGFLMVEVVRPTQIEGTEFFEIGHLIVHSNAPTDRSDGAVV